MSKFCQSTFLSAAEQKGFELLEFRGQDPRLASLDTLSGEEVPLHLLLRLHGYVIQVGDLTSKSHDCDTSGCIKSASVEKSLAPFRPRWCSCTSGRGTTCGTARCASRPAWTDTLLLSGCSIMGATLERLTGEWHARFRCFLFFVLLCRFQHQSAH